MVILGNFQLNIGQYIVNHVLNIYVLLRYLHLYANEHLSQLKINFLLGIFTVFQFAFHYGDVPVNCSLDLSVISLD